jgi:hypothetical protein
MSVGRKVLQRIFAQVRDLFGGNLRFAERGGLYELRRRNCVEPNGSNFRMSRVFCWNLFFGQGRELY